MVSLSIPSSFSEVCSTPGCVQSALNILADIDLNVDPCSDFYQYTCGGWLQNASIPDSESSVGTFNRLRDANSQVIEKILTGSYADMALVNTNDEEKLADESNFKLAKDFYDSCMNEDAINRLGSKPLRDFIDPLRKDSVLDALVRLELTGASNPIFSAGVNPDEKNPVRNVITLMQPGFGLPSKEYFDQEIYLALYRKTMKALSKAIHLDLTEDLVDRVVDFETQLARISLPLEELQDPITAYNVISLVDLEQRYAFIDWHRFFDDVTDGTTPTTIVLATPSFFDKLDTLWKKTDEQTIKNYIVLSSARQTVHLVDKSTNDPLQEMNIKLTGRKTIPSRSHLCIQNTGKAFGDILGHYFINLVFPDLNDTSQKVQKELDTIHDIFAQRLGSIDWLDDQTRAMALDKIKKMKIKSMYGTISPDVRSPLSLKKYYQGISTGINPDDQFGNTVAISSWMAKKKWSSLNEPVDKEKWFMSPQVVNAYFSANFNQVVVPAGILQPPFFDTNSIPLSLGGIGVVIGHEITHGFDNTGRLYDGDGVLTQWWTNVTKNQFEDKAQCFIDQYNGFSIQGPDGEKHHVNGKMTLGENLADNGGLSLAYEAFSREPQQRLAGLDVSPEALFFINYGRVWCEKSRPERAVQKILVDVHSPARVRVNAAIQNMPDFAKVFDCPANAPMNPSKKCKLW